MVVNELRSESVHARFLQLFEPHFAVRKVPRGKMDPVHQHPAIDIFLMKLRRQRPSKQLAAVADGNTQQAEVQAPEGRATEQLLEPGENAADVCRADVVEAEAADEAAEDSGATELDEERAAEDQPSEQLSLDVSDMQQQTSTTAAAAAVGQISRCSRPCQGKAACSQSQSGCDDKLAMTVAAEIRCHREWCAQLSERRTPVDHAEKWQTRRQGAEAARLLATVCLPLE